jgi:MFS superfamily sulfate permease-like transporter
MITRGRLCPHFPFSSLHSTLPHPVPNIVFLSLPSGLPAGIVLLYAFCISAIHVTFSANRTLSIEYVEVMTLVVIRVIFRVLAADNIKTIIFWNVTACGLADR